MMPKSRGARIAFSIVLAAAGVLLLTSIGVTIWSQSGEEGWVAKAVIAFMSWVVSVPVVLAACIWTLVLWFRDRDSGHRETLAVEPEGSAHRN